VTNADVTLDAIGNITWKMGIGSYTYHATKKRAVIQAGTHSYGYDANGNLTSRDGSTISYTSYNLPSGINAGSNSSTLSYGAFRNRSKQVAVTAGITETTIYVGGLLEKVTRGSITEYRHRIEGGAGLAALYTRRTSGSPLTDTYYVHSDHLGSPELMTNSSGASVIKLSFGAYGERRDSDRTPYVRYRQVIVELHRPGEVGLPRSSNRTFPRKRFPGCRARPGCAGRAAPRWRGRSPGARRARCWRRSRA